MVVQPIDPLLIYVRRLYRENPDRGAVIQRSALRITPASLENQSFGRLGYEHNKEGPE